METLIKIVETENATAMQELACLETLDRIIGFLWSKDDEVPHKVMRLMAGIVEKGF